MNRKHPYGSRALQAPRLRLRHNPGRTRSRRSTRPKQSPVTPAGATGDRLPSDRSDPPKLPSAATFARQKEAEFEESVTGLPRGRALPASPSVAEPPAVRPGAREHC